MRNAGGQYIVERGDAIGRYKQKMLIVQMVDVAYLPAGVQFQIGEVSTKQNWIEKLGAHVGILHLENVAYSNSRKIFVNDISDVRRQVTHTLERKSVDSGNGNSR